MMYVASHLLFIDFILLIHQLVTALWWLVYWWSIKHVRQEKFVSLFNFQKHKKDNNQNSRYNRDGHLSNHNLIDLPMTFQLNWSIILFINWQETVKDVQLLQVQDGVPYIQFCQSKFRNNQFNMEPGWKHKELP